MFSLSLNFEQLKSVRGLPVDESSSARLLKGSAEHADVVLGAVSRVRVVTEVFWAVEVGYFGFAGRDALATPPAADRSLLTRRESWGRRGR